MSDGNNGIDALTEAQEYLNEQFNLLGKIVETALGTHSIFSKQLIVKNLEELRQKWTDCRVAFRNQQKRIEAIEGELKKQSTAIETLNIELGRIKDANRQPLSDDQRKNLKGERKDYKESLLETKEK